MPRNHNAGPSTLRNRNRVTNKTRLKVITESIDADPIVLDEDEEKIRVVSTAGVDAEDANEHHLQAVLSAAATRHQAHARSTRAASEKEKTEPAAYIPTPDSTGIVGNYEELYPSGRWKDPTTYVKFSDTVEESISFSLTNGFIFYMDERDKEWLDKNNEEARGEGTSAQGSVSSTSTRSGRSSKAKGKDPEISQPIAMSEDEFELVMAIFEKVTHEKTEFLHHGLEQGTPFPPFSDYQDTFTTDLPPSTFALFTKPASVPPPSQLLRLARTVYPYWRERRIERAGHPIIPTVNLDETDSKNESYICFRRREIKAVRKTRAQQVTYSDKLTRLRDELDEALKLSNFLMRREKAKRESAHHAHTVWDKRFTLAEFKRKYPSLCSKEDDDLFYDKERVPKKPRLESTAPRENGDLASPTTHTEPPIRPKERWAQIQSQIEDELSQRKEKDHGWEDATDNPYQPSPVSHASKLFKVVTAARRSAASKGNEIAQHDRTPRAGRLRFGRGGRIHLDRCAVFRHVSPSGFLAEDGDNEDETQERVRRLTERWRYDVDDVPAVGPDGSEEKDRGLLDDFSTKYLVHHVALLNDQDYSSLTTDATITTTSSDGRPQSHLPFRFTNRKDIPGMSQRPSPIPLGQPISAVHSASSSLSLSSVGTPVSVATSLKNIAPPNVPHMRISSNGAMRPPGLPTIPSMPAAISTSHTSPHNTPSVPVGHVNGTHDSAAQITDGVDQTVRSPAPNGHTQVSNDQSQPDALSSATTSLSPVRAKTQVQQPISMPSMHNGYHMTPVNSYSNPMPTPQYMHPSSRPNVQQMPNFKSAFA
ncbi:hypothetical protein POSPLADRAFT_1167718, partial [Postia placenta MAD-698-R-SB12]